MTCYSKAFILLCGMVVTINHLNAQNQDDYLSSQAGLGARNFSLHECNRRYYWQGVGALSIKSFYNGQTRSEVNKARYLVDDHSCLFFNHDQPHAITIAGEQKAESFCIFFAKGFAEERHSSLIANAVLLLDEPCVSAAPKPHLFERTYSHDGLARNMNVVITSHHGRIRVPRRERSS